MRNTNCFQCGVVSNDLTFILLQKQGFEHSFQIIITFEDIKKEEKKGKRVGKGKVKKK